MAEAIDCDEEKKGGGKDFKGGDHDEIVEPITMVMCRAVRPVGSIYAQEQKKL